MTQNGGKREKMVGVYERPASADRRLRRWLPWLIALVVTLAWLAYFAFAR
jgi:hypothetical protein